MRRFESAAQNGYSTKQLKVRNRNRSRVVVVGGGDVIRKFLFLPRISRILSGCCLGNYFTVLHFNHRLTNKRQRRVLYVIY